MAPLRLRPVHALVLIAQLGASVNGQAVLIGNRKLMEAEQVALPAYVQELIEAFQSSGKTTILVAVEGRLAGVLAVADTLRPDAITAIQEIRRIGVKQTVLLTGDNPRVAAAIAQQIGLTTVRAELLPEDKAAAIQHSAASSVRPEWWGTGSTTPPHSPTRRWGSPWAAPPPMWRWRPPTWP